MKTHRFSHAAGRFFLFAAITSNSLLPLYAQTGENIYESKAINLNFDTSQKVRTQQNSFASWVLSGSKDSTGKNTEISLPAGFDFPMSDFNGNSLMVYRGGFLTGLFSKLIVQKTDPAKEDGAESEDGKGSEDESKAKPEPALPVLPEITPDDLNAVSTDTIESSQEEKPEVLTDPVYRQETGQPEITYSDLEQNTAAADVLPSEKIPQEEVQSQTIVPDIQELPDAEVLPEITEDEPSPIYIEETNLQPEVTELEGSVAEIPADDNGEVILQQEAYQNEVLQAKSYMHSVKAIGLAPEFYYPYTVSFMNSIRAGVNRLSYSSGDLANADLSLGEIVFDYCCLSSGGSYYQKSDANGTYLQLTDEAFAQLYNAILSMDSQWLNYPSQVEAACYTLNLNTTDRDLVNQINNYICSRFNYLLVDQTSMPSFMNTGVGQCYHYARLFADMCSSVGIPAWKVETTEHAWCEVQVDGQIYTFDPTKNDTSGNWTKYVWVQ